MGLGHEKLDVYRLSIGYVAWVYDKADSLLGGRGYSVVESSTTYQTEPVAVDPDSDFDFDPEDEKPQQAAARNTLTRVGAP